VLVVLWNCYYSLRTFSDVALVYFVISLVVSFAQSQICWTEDAWLTRNRFPSKAIAITFGCVTFVVSWCWTLDLVEKH